MHPAHIFIITGFNSSKAVNGGSRCMNGHYAYLPFTVDNTFFATHDGLCTEAEAHFNAFTFSFRLSHCINRVGCFYPDHKYGYSRYAHESARLQEQDHTYCIAVRNKMPTILARSKKIEYCSRINQYPLHTHDFAAKVKEILTKKNQYFGADCISRMETMFKWQKHRFDAIYVAIQTAKQRLRAVQLAMPVFTKHEFGNKFHAADNPQSRSNVLNSPYNNIKFSIPVRLLLSIALLEDKTLLKFPFNKPTRNCSNQKDFDVMKRIDTTGLLVNSFKAAITS